MINNVASIIFDCDGVILNSNKVKKNAYYKVASCYYGDQLATLLTNHLRSNTGKTRDYFFNYFVDNIVPKSSKGLGAEFLLAEVEKEIKYGLINCEISKSLFELKDKFSDSKWFVISGGVESELREVFLQRSISEIFDGGIFGGPRTKDEILKFLIEDNQINFPAIFIGDSRFDYEVAKRFNLDFIFLSDWTEFKEWRLYCQKNNIRFLNSLSDLLK